jgi:xylulokinase
LALGGGAKSAHWLEMLASTLGIVLDVPRAGDFGAGLGAARLGMMAGAGLGPESATAPPLARSIEPDPRLVPAMADAHDRYKRAYTLLKDF